jgi:hypothetical protein
LPPYVTGVPFGIEAAHGYRSRIWQKQGGDKLKRSRFSAAVWAEQYQNRRIGGREGDVSQGNRFTFSLASEPIEQGGTMAKYFANRLEDDSIHESEIRTA